MDNFKKRFKEIFTIPNLIVSLIIAVVVGLIFARGGFAEGGYLWYIEINIDSSKVDSTLTNFPVYLSDTIAELATTANGGEIENTDSGGITGSLTIPADFTIGDSQSCDSTEYSFEFEDYDSSDGSFGLFVKIPEISSSVNTKFYICFSDTSVVTGNENISDVWSNGYVSVWHLAETSGTFYDSVGNHDGTDNVSDTGKDGVLGAGQVFDGSDAISLSASSDFQDTTVNVSMWEYFPSTSSYTEVLFDNTTSSPGGGEGGWMIKNNGKTTVREIGGSGVTAGVLMTDDQWNYFSVNYDLSSGSVSTYNNGGLADTQTVVTFTPSSVGPKIGSRNDPIWFSPLNGKLDEVRFSSVERADDWIQSQYYTQSNPTTFSVFESPVEADSPPEIVMGESSDATVPEGVVDAIETALGVYRPDDDMDLDPEDMANMWACTSIGESSVEDYYWVGVAGMIVDDPEELDNWSLANSIWDGLAIVYDNGDTTYEAHISGSVGYSNMLSTAGLSDISSPDIGGTGSATYYFPFPPGYVAFYGYKGIHDDVGPVGTGYGGRGWLAIDWVGGATYSDNVYPNSVYVSQSGTVSYVCRDSVQTWVQIGDFLYGHLNDNETLDYEVYHSQGSYLGSLITGSHATKCGRTDQQPTSYHLHIGFKPDGNYFQWEDWVLDLTDSKFHRGGDTVGVGEYMLAEWAPRIIVPTPGPTVTPGGPTPTPGYYPAPPSDDQGGGTGSIWDGFISGLKILVRNRVAYLNDPDYEPEELPEGVTFPLMMLSGIRIAIRSIHVLLTSSLNLSMTIFVFMMVVIMEPIRFIRGLWIGIKEMIPFL